MFVFGPALLMIGSWHRILLATVTAVIGVTALAASLHGYFLRPTRLWERFFLFGAALLLIKPGWITDLIGLGALAVVLLSQQAFKRAAEEPPPRRPASEPAPPAAKIPFAKAPAPFDDASAPTGRRRKINASGVPMPSMLRAASLTGAVVLAAAAAQAQPLQSLGEPEGFVDIVAWPGYIERGETDKAYDWVTDFEEQTGCKVNVKTANTSDEMVALMNEGGFDLVTASGDASLRLIAGKRVQEVNTDLIPSWSTVDARLQDAPWHTVDGKHYGVPYQWGSNVLMYNTEVFTEPPDELERGVRGDDPAGRQVEQGPRAGVRRADLHRRRRALPDAPQAGARHQGSLRADRGAVQGGARPAAPAARRSSAATGTTPSCRSTTSPTRAWSRLVLAVPGQLLRKRRTSRSRAPSRRRAPPAGPTPP